MSIKSLQQKDDLEFKEGVVDIVPKIVYKYCKIHNQSQGG